MTTPLAAKIARDYGTPCAVIDMDKVERNIARVQAACDGAGLANRPHIKTHKSPFLAKMQIAAGARGITCQKLGEAEIMADAGIDDILISYNLIGDEKMARLAALQAKANMTVAADNEVVIAGLPKAAEISGRPLSVVVECDTGRKRAGAASPRRCCAGSNIKPARRGKPCCGWKRANTNARRSVFIAAPDLPPAAHSATTRECRRAISKQASSSRSRSQRDEYFLNPKISSGSRTPHAATIVSRCTAL